MGAKYMKKLIFAGAALLGLSCAVAIGAEEVAPTKVMFNDDLAVEKSLTGAPGDAEKGRKWYAGRKLGNCLACHVTADLKEQPFHGEVGPAMAGVADRYKEPQLRAIVANSKKVFGKQTIMPGFYTHEIGVRPAKKFEGKTILTAQQVEDIVAYLKTMKE